MKKVFTILLSVSLLLLIVHKSGAQKQSSIDDVKELVRKFQYTEAIRLSDNLLKTDSTHSELYLIKAQALKEIYKFSEAINSLKKGLVLDPNSIPILYEMASVYWLSGDNQRSYDTYEILLKLEPENIFFKIQMANTMLAANAKVSAKKILLDILKSDSLNHYILQQTGSCYNDLNVTDSAIYYYHKALAVNPADFVLLSKLSMLYIKTKNYDKGLELTENFRRADSTKKDVDKWCGYFYYLNKQYKPAITRFKEYLTQNTDAEASKFANKYLGMSLYKSDLLSPAINYFQAAYKADTSDSEVTFYLGVCLSRTFGLDSSIIFLKKTLDLIMPSNSFLAMIYSELGEAYDSKNETDTALTFIYKAYQTDTANLNLLFKLAYQYDYFFDDRDKALEYYKEYVRLEPESFNKDAYMSSRDYAKKRITEIGKNISIARTKKK
jgi:tetratricopeptide (TPR) repeat protein